MFRIRLWFIPVIMLSLLSTSCLSDENDRLALIYHVNRGEGFDLVLNLLDGSVEKVILNDEGWEWEPQWNATDQMVVYNHMDTSGQFSIRGSSLDGKTRKIYSNTHPELQIDRSGTMAAWVRETETENLIVIAPLEDLKDTTIIAAGPGNRGRPVWSDDGRKLVFNDDGTGSMEMYLYTHTEGSVTRLTYNNLREKYASFSPLGDRLAVTMAMDTLPNDIFLIDLQSKEVEQVTSSPENESELNWSPTGNLISFHALKNSQDDIFILDIGKKEITNVTDGNGYHGEPLWIRLSPATD